MRFLLINASERTARLEDHADLNTAMAKVGLKPTEVDHASLGGRVGMMVYEFGLFKDPSTTSYFTLKRQDGSPSSLYEGNAALYAYDEMGETIDFPAEMIPTVEYMTGDEAKAYVEAGIITRPVMSENGVEQWRWPDPNPMVAPAR